MAKKSFLLSLLSLVLLTTACTKPSDQQYEPLVVDNTGCLTATERSLFIGAAYPVGVVPVIVGVETFDEPWRTGAMVDDLFNQLEDSLDAVDFDDFGLLVCISREPRLMQLRMGDYYGTYATLCGVTTGRDYMELQKAFAEGQEQALGQLLAKACENVHERQHLSWYQRTQLSNISGAINSALDWMAQPSESFYGKYITRQLYKNISWGSRFFGSWIWGLAWVFLLIFIAQWGIRKILNLFSPWFSNLIVLLFGLTFSVSTAACAMLLSNGRMEDLLSIQAFGIPGIERFIADPSLFAHEHNVWLTGAFLFLTMLSVLLSRDITPMALLPYSVQRAQWQQSSEVEKGLLLGMYDAGEMKNDESAPYCFIAMSSFGNLGTHSVGLTIAALFFLPFAVLWTGLIYACVKILLQIPAYLSVIKKRRGYMSYDLPSIGGLLGSSLIILLLLTVVTIGIDWVIDPFDRRDIHDEQQPVEVVLRTVTVRAKVANLRTGPGTHYDKAALMPDGTGGNMKVTRGTILKVIDESDGWYAIRVDDGRTLYIKASLTE